MDERALTERLITYDTSTLEGMQAAAAFVYGWLEARDVEVKGETHNGRPVLAATVGPDSGPTVVLHGHLDVVPANPTQYEPRVEGDRLIGRGAYDMKGGLAAMMCAVRDLAAQDAVKVHFVVVCDEESDEQEQRASDFLVEQGYIGDFAITGEPTDLHIGVQAKGVLVLRLLVSGRSAHGSTPWLGDNAVVKAVDAFRSIESLPFARESSDLFDRPSISLGKIVGGDAVNRVPDACTIDLDIRYLPGQDPEDIIAAVGRAARHRGHEGLPPRPDRGLARRALRAGAGRGGVEGEPGGVEHRGRPRRHVRRHLLPQRRHPGCRVRPDRGWSPWARRVGFDPVARRISAGAGRVRQPDPRRAPESPT